MHSFVCVPLNAKELLLNAQRAELTIACSVACRHALKCQKLQQDVSEWLVDEFM